MRTQTFVRNLKYDAVPRTIGPIEQFIREACTSFDTTHATESQYVNCAGCAVMVRSDRAMTTWRSCRWWPEDS